MEALADELASAPGLMSEKLLGAPVCDVRGYSYQRGRGRARDLIRPRSEDLFR